MSDLTAAARYALYAPIRRRLLTEASKRIPLASVASQARALTLWDGKQVRPADEMQLAAVFDLGVLDPVGGQSRAIERQAKAEPPDPGSDDDKVLQALMAARFGLVRLQGERAEGGIAATRFPNGDPLVIWDNHLMRNRAPGALIGARLAFPDPDLAMTCGTAIGLDSRAVERLLLGVAPQRGPVLPSLPRPEDDAALEALVAEPAARLRLEQLAAGPGFAAMVYRTAIDLGLMGPIPGRTPPEALPQQPGPA
ncbi:hypothetical protein [Paracraurococcus ruber]|uniref:Uncharacterized protein n=1 Tax=Paracraurococcus ruber TaxID=77675 RepID=A0ABS1CZE6_9PROT|nr:hypothetical protein [Paracraurococcus ruber]MBK1659815.1 hypothetical protein [Paracraurococcus ruber]TDG31443.1 hypothetical protein E2C05_11025 [Paracraurococcus ruber]